MRERRDTVDYRKGEKRERKREEKKT